MLCSDHRARGNPCKKLGSSVPSWSPSPFHLRQCVGRPCRAAVLPTCVSEIVEADGVGETGLGGERVLVAGGVLAENVRALDFWVRIAVSN
jgi:hypothetical protein